MVKIAFISDLHFDINQIDPNQTIDRIADYLTQMEVDAYLIAGDLFNDFNLSAEYISNLQNKLPKTKVRYIVGNHDLAGVDFQTAESDANQFYLHNKFLDIDDVRIIGNNGWYDYGFLRGDYSNQEILKWKEAYWYDQQLDMGGLSDQERTNLVLGQISHQLLAAQQAKQKIVFMTHFVPRFDYIRRFPSEEKWDKVNAVLGSPRISELLDMEYVLTTIFGHLHVKPAPLKVGNNVYYNQSLGYRNQNSEWLSTDFLSEWHNRLQIIDL